MANVFVEPRPKGRDGDAISHYVVEDHADSVLAEFGTQQEAVAWANQQGHTPHVARVRYLTDKRSRINGALSKSSRTSAGRCARDPGPAPNARTGGYLSITRWASTGSGSGRDAAGERPGTRLKIS